ITIIYVDDGLFVRSDQNLVNQKKFEFMNCWKCRDLGDAKEFLGMHIQRQGKCILLDQTTYLKKVVECFGITNANPTPCYGK
ncbi:hypothetical protein AX16_001935, partial [Volvariella volvacea WC 439]